MRPPDDVAADAQGNIYFSDRLNNHVRMVTVSTGVITTVAGNGSCAFSGDGGPASSATLCIPGYLHVDARGNIYINDAGNGRVRMITKSSGIITTVAGNGGIGYSGDGRLATDSSIYKGFGIAVDIPGNIYICDTLENSVRKVTKSTGIISTIAGTGSINNGGFAGDGGLATLAKLNLPHAVAVDASGNVFFTDTLNNRVRMVSVTTGIITTVVGGGTLPLTIGGPGVPRTLVDLDQTRGISLDAAGNMFLARFHSGLILKVTKSSGLVTIVAGIYSGGFSGDGGPATSAKIGSPTDVVVDTFGNIHITDPDNIRIRTVATMISGSWFAFSSTSNERLERFLMIFF